jgi:predicted transcriptional regulator
VLAALRDTPLRALAGRGTLLDIIEETMPLTVNPELEQQLMALADASGRDAQEMANRALQQYIARETEIVAKIRIGLEQAERGQTSSHADVVARQNARLAGLERLRP